MCWLLWVGVGVSLRGSFGCVCVVIVCGLLRRICWLVIWWFGWFGYVVLCVKLWCAMLGLRVLLLRFLVVDFGLVYQVWCCCYCLFVCGVWFWFVF